MHKVTNEKSSWFGQVGEFVRHEVEGSFVVLRMPGSRLVEFAAADVAPHEPEAEAEAPKADDH